MAKRHRRIRYICQVVLRMIPIDGIANADVYAHTYRRVNGKGKGVERRSINQRTSQT